LPKAAVCELKTTFHKYNLGKNQKMIIFG